MEILSLPENEPFITGIGEPSEEVLAGFKEKAQPFYEMGADFGWSDGLYDTVKKAMGAE